MKWNTLSLKNGEAAAPLYNYPWVFREKPYRIWLICWKYSWLLPTLLFSVNASRDWKSATQISEHFLLLQAMAWPSKCQSMTQTMSCKCEVGRRWRICWGSFLSWSRTCWHIFEIKSNPSFFGNIYLSVFFLSMMKSQFLHMCSSYFSTFHRDWDRNWCWVGVKVGGIWVGRKKNLTWIFPMKLTQGTGYLILDIHVQFW